MLITQKARKKIPRIENRREICLESFINCKMKLNGAFNKKYFSEAMEGFSEEPIKAGSSKAVEIPGTKAKCLETEFPKNL